ncbi:DUF6443 domain-containing protein [Flavobacterium tructae]|uniref:DUF6443 domain-containing protein n=1 Tax=Flavobacterium tructae TaxID=1114873 RepID=UPI0035A95961
MKKYLSLLIFLLFAGSNIIAQTAVNITKPEPQNTEYVVTGNETLIATQSIILKPNTWIKSGSTFTAKISTDAYISGTFSDENYVFSRIYQNPLKNSSEIASNKDVLEKITYYDELGRPMQSIAIKASPTYKDIVTPIEYDKHGRQDKEYLPYIDSNGANASYRNTADAIAGDISYYKSYYPLEINNDKPNPFLQKKLEDSPLNRVFQQASPGLDWSLGNGHEIKFDYETNGNDEVKLYVVSLELKDNIYKPTLSISAINGGNYAAGELFKSVVKDENNNVTEEFKDKQGQIILKKAYGVSIVNGVSVNTAHETYYIYDDYGNLTFVLPPKANNEITESILENLSYQYRYDSKNRLAEKKLPGKGWEYIVYDQLDRPVLTQDANLRAENKWLFTKYDNFNRPLYTGEYLNTVETTRALIQNLVNSSLLFENRTATTLNINGTEVNYTNVAFPVNNIDLLTINYYDDYLNFNSKDSDVPNPANVASYGVTPISNAKGLITCTKVRVLDNPSWIKTVNYYDSDGRIIYNYNKNNFLETINTTKSKFDFVGKLLETTTTHQRSGTTITIVDTFTYDHTGRLLTQKQKVNNQDQELIASNSYDDLGKLITKEVGGKINQARLQIINYRYNIRGWLKNINDINTMGNDLFAFQMNYNDITNNNKKLYNGNISQTLWKTANLDKNLKSYTYTYDGLNRLNLATDNLNQFEENVTYDKNGNIMQLSRNGNTIPGTANFGPIDNLIYSYNGNKLAKVEDSVVSNREGFIDGSNISEEYTYDANGNMKTDANKGITTPISYNYLDLPNVVTLRGGHIKYTYDAVGVKQRKVVNGITTDYANGFQYENNELKFFPHSEGYVSNNKGIYSYIYNYKDHLGNIRVSYGDANSNGTIESSEIIEENNYYPFGLKHGGYNYVTSLGKGNETAQKYKYNGKELQDELQLNVYDYGARNYDPALGRWMSIDPLAEKSRRFNPFTYALNNPIYFIDPDGMEAKSTGVKLNKDGTYTVVSGKADGDKNVYIADKNGNYDKNSKTIGKSVSDSSFLDEKGKAVVGAIINTKSYEGSNFINNEIIKESPFIVTYMRNAGNGETYDLKDRGIDKIGASTSELQHRYRGSIGPNGEIGSARDFGDMGAGIVAGRFGLSWQAARLGFDGYQTYTDTSFKLLETEVGPTIQMIGGPRREAQISQKAQKAGWNIGIQLNKQDDKIDFFND